MKRPGREDRTRRPRSTPPFGHTPVSAPRDALDEIQARAAADDDLNAPPPVGGSWGRLYTGVVLTLILYILALWLFARVYAP